MTTMDIVLQITFSLFLLLISVQDIRTKTISDIPIFIFSGVHLSLRWIQGVGLLEIFKGVLAGFLLYYSIYLAVKLIYHREAFGFGDVLLLSSIGIVLGVEKTIFAGLLTFYIALFEIILLCLARKSLDLKMEIPLAPAISTAAILSFYGGDRVIAWLQRFIF